MLSLQLHSIGFDDRLNWLRTYWLYDHQKIVSKSKSVLCKSHVSRRKRLIAILIVTKINLGFYCFKNIHVCLCIYCSIRYHYLSEKAILQYQIFICCLPPLDFIQCHLHTSIIVVSIKIGKPRTHFWIWFIFKEKPISIQDT